MANLVRLLRDKMRMLREDALAVAAVVEEAFQGSEAVDDDLLDVQLRQLFYDLQDAQILDVQRREYTCEGRLLRGYAWTVKQEGGTRFDRPSPVRVAEEDVYATLPSRAWSERRPPE